MSRGRYIRWVTDSGRNPEWLLREYRNKVKRVVHEYRNKVKRVVHIRQVLKNPSRINKHTGRLPTPIEIDTYKQSLPIRERDIEKCRQAIRWLARQGFIKKPDLPASNVSK
jgi:hypothetical protein